MTIDTPDDYLILPVEYLVISKSIDNPLQSVRGTRVKIIDEMGGPFFEIEGRDDDCDMNIVRLNPGELSAVANAAAMLLKAVTPTPKQQDPLPFDNSIVFDR